MPFGGKRAGSVAFYFYPGIILHLPHILLLNFLHSIWYLEFQSCMQSEFYPFQSDDSRLYFEFLSVSPARSIRKAVMFTPLSSNRAFNLALLDILPDKTFCGQTISNNGDLEKVMATVAQCIAHFFEHYPSADIYLQGNTPTRTRLYRIIISRELQKIRKYYEIYGTIDSKLELFESNKNYELYLLRRKPDETHRKEH